eukprot:EG_transcript_3420
MPGLVMLHRRWHVGADDVYLMAGLALLFNGLFCAGIAAAFVFFRTNSTCAGSTEEEEVSVLATAYYAAMLTVHALRIALALQTIRVSLRGTPLDTEVRRSVPALMYATLFLFLLELALQVLYSVFIASSIHSNPCIDPWAARLTYTVWLVSLVYLGLQVVVTFLLYDSVGRYSTTAVATQLKYDQVWRRRCMCFLGCRYQPQHAWVWDDVAHFFAALFRFMDVVPSDIYAGVVLLRAQEKLAAQSAAPAAAAHPLSESTLSLAHMLGRPQPPVDLATLQEVTHFAKYFMGCYGFRITVFLHPLNGLCRLLPFCGGCCNTPRRGDACGLHLAAVRRFTGAGPGDVAHVDNTSQVFRPAYYVAVDHEYQSVVLALRGTISISDCITDMAAKAVYSEELGCAVHHGFLLSAQNVQKELTELGVLPRLLEANPQYRLVVLGHSLGAATAVVLSCLLRPTFGDRLHCLAYSPPQVFDKEGVEMTKPFVTSVILWKDMVPRLSIRSIVVWKDAILQALAHAKCSKGRILFRHNPCWNLHMTPTDLVLPDGDPIAQERLQRFRRSGEEGRELALELAQPVERDFITEAPQLFPPGRIVHLQKEGIKLGGRGCCLGRKKQRQYAAYWVENDSFADIVTSPAMWKDHMPWTVLKELRTLTAAARSAEDHRAEGSDLL